MAERPFLTLQLNVQTPRFSRSWSMPPATSAVLSWTPRWPSPWRCWERSAAASAAGCWRGYMPCGSTTKIEHGSYVERVEPSLFCWFFCVVDHSDPPNCRLYILGTKNLEPPASGHMDFKRKGANSAVWLVAEDLEQNGGQLDLPIHGCVPGRLGLQDHLSLGDDGDLVAGSVWRWNTFEIAGDPGIFTWQLVVLERLWTAHPGSHPVVLAYSGSILVA